MGNDPESGKPGAVWYLYSYLRVRYPSRSERWEP